jgi:hypothetical protein
MVVQARVEGKMTEKLPNVPRAVIGPALLAWYKLIHYQIPDPAPYEVSAAEATKLAKEVIRTLAAYVPHAEVAQLLDGAHGRVERIATGGGQDFRETGQFQVYSHSAGHEPGCCVGVGGRIVCVTVAQ